MKKFNLIQHLADQPLGEQKYREILREGTMSVGIYILPAGSRDPQQPHTEDELYYIIAGTARFSAAAASEPVQPGDVLFVPAGQPHKFIDIEQDLVILVVYSPPESA
jgi:mannose-6-phosphate isomerase-like protein (cupin superfamily)